MKETGIRFGRYAVTDLDGKKTRVYYSINNRHDGRECVVITAKNYFGKLRFLPNCKNDTDIMIDYFDKDRAVIFKGEPLYESALEAAMRGRK